MEIKCEGTCNNNSVDSVTIPRDRYEELIEMETRADVLVNMARKEKIYRCGHAAYCAWRIATGGR